MGTAEGRANSLVAVWRMEPDAPLGQGLGCTARRTLSRSTPGSHTLPVSWRTARDTAWLEAQGGGQGDTAPEHTRETQGRNRVGRRAQRPPHRSLSLFLTGAEIHLRDGAWQTRALTYPPQEEIPAAGVHPTGTGKQAQSRPQGAHMSTKTMKHQPRPPTSSMVTWMP